MKKWSKYLLQCALCLGLVTLSGPNVPAVMASDQKVDASAQEATQQATQQAPLEQEALDALDAMSKYLRTLPFFEADSTFFRDEVLTTGQKILVSGKSALTVKFPDKLFSHVTIDEKERSFSMYYDGKTLSLHGGDSNFYTSVSAPPTLKELVMTTFSEKGIELPLQDLFLWGTDASNSEGIISAMVIGKSLLAGESCTHYAYRQEGVDWQIWIKEGEQPLPLQLVITTTSYTSQPQYSARIKWNLTPKISDDLFAFTPPKDAHAIDFYPLADAQNEKGAKDE